LSPNCPRELAGNLLQVRWTHDVIAIEHASGSVTGDCHRDSLRHALVDHVPQHALSVHTLYTMVSQRRMQFVKVGRLTKFDLRAIDS
jgi:hypothetical protein